MYRIHEIRKKICLLQSNDLNFTVIMVQNVTRHNHLIKIFVMLDSLLIILIKFYESK